ncbi:MAG: hypothetical protein ABW104_06680 [Candidatus Thiodiazotropha sp. 6PLUC2]
MNKRLGLMLGLIFLPMPGFANDSTLSVRLGSLGFGVEAGISLTDQFSARLGLNRYDLEFDERVDGIEYDLDLEMRSISLLADWHPFESSFRFTAGVFRNNSEITGATRYAITTIGDTVYRDVGLEADLDFRSFAPYFGLGWETGLFNAHGWGFNVDLGLMYQGSGSVNLTATGSAADLVDPNDLALEEQRFEEDIEDYKYYPVFSFGVSYRFK